MGTQCHALAVPTERMDVRCGCPHGVADVPVALQMSPWQEARTGWWGGLCVHRLPLCFSLLLLPLELGTSSFSAVLCIRDGRVRDKTTSRELLKNHSG